MSWVSFVKDYRSKNPTLTYKECLSLASPLYKQSKSSNAPVSETKVKKVKKVKEVVVDPVVESVVEMPPIAELTIEPVKVKKKKRKRKKKVVILEPDAEI